MRIFTAALGTESNTFAPIPTDWRSFEEAGLYAPGAHPAEPTLITAPTWVLRQRAPREGWTVIEGTCAWAEPAGTVAREVYEALRNRILAELKAALPVDAVMLGMHGAMVAHGYPDCEGDLLSHVREIVGPDVAIGGELDPHCHLSQKMIDAADILICFKEFPHTDFVARGEEVVELTARTARGEIKPTMSLYDCRMMGSFPTSREPMRSFVDEIMTRENENRILSISLAHGFPFGDVPDMGTRTLVITDGDQARGDALAAELGQRLIAMRGQTAPPFLSIDAALDRALSRQGPIVIADVTDNAGGGAGSDANGFLHRVLERGIEGVCAGPVWDPIAVRFCHGAGEGAKLPLRFGGKVGPASGLPIDAEVEVMRCVPEAMQTFAEAPIEMGAAASIRFNGIEVALVSRRRQAFAPNLFSNLGINPSAKRIVIVKSTNHFYAGFAPIAEEVLYVDADGPLPRDLTKLAFQSIDRPKWPFDPDLFD
ncbi:MAG: M81 family metallopeptidase [Pseudomonadota bacterium]